MLVQSTAAVRDTIAAVFRQPEYDRSLRDTLWNRIWTWIRGVLERLFGAVGDSPALAWAARLLLALVVLAIVGRVAYVLWARVRASDARRHLTTLAGVATGGDPWRQAQAEAAAGRYTEAAHLLYLALLQALAGRERLRLHPSKTVGDYARELRARSSDALPAFRAFGRTYERVVYDMQYCDRERYDDLRTLAAPLMGSRG